MKWSRVFPFITWRGLFDRQGLRGDALAALLGVLVLLPQGLLFATIAGLPLEYGFYAALVPALIAALWGSSRHLAWGPTAVLSFLIFATVTPLVGTSGALFVLPGGAPEFVRLALTLTMLAGLVQLALGSLRLGIFAKFVSEAVLVGFTAGVALLLAAAQVRSFFGIPVERGASVWKAFSGIFRFFTDINTLIAAVAVFTVVVVVCVRRWLPRWPHLFIALLLGSAFAWGLNQFYGNGRTGVMTIDALAFTWPPFARPDLSWKSFGQLLPIAIAAALLALAHAGAVARQLAQQSGQKIDLDQDTRAMGLGNLLGSFFGGTLIGASAHRSTQNLRLGARTPLAALLALLLLFVVVWFTAKYATHVPVAVVAALLVVVAWDLVDVGRIKALWRSGRQEAAVLVVTFLGTQLLDLTYAVYLGVLLALLLHGVRTARPHLADDKPGPQLKPVQFVARADVPDCPQLKMLRLDGALTFASIEHLHAELEAVDINNPDQKHLLLVASAVEVMDVAAAACLAHEALRRRALGGGLYLFDVKDSVLATLQSQGAADVIGAAHIFAAGSDPVAEIFKLLNPYTCVACERRIFAVCPKPVELTWARPPGDKTKGRYAVPPTAWARPKQSV